MTHGRIIGIQVAPAPGAAMAARESVRAVAGGGLEGDHRFTPPGEASTPTAPGRQATLIEIEAIEALQRDYASPLQARDSRRNLVTRGVALNHLVGREFTVGAVRLRGVKLCEPCTHLAGLTGDKALPAGLVHRGGLRAELLSDGEIRVGDEVRTADSTAS